MYFSPIEADPEQNSTSRRWREVLRKRPLLLGLPITGLVLLAIYGTAGTDEAKADAPPPPTVTVSLPLQQSIVEWDDHVGRFEASQMVEVRPRVSGALQAIHFRDGDTVAKGQLLFTIDPRPFEAWLAEARAKEADAATKLALARSELARAERLIDDEAVSREEVDTLRAAARSAEAGVAATRAQVRARALDLEFTRVRAPIAGRISDRRVDVGNLVGGAAQDATLLTTIQALDPIYFSFEASEALYLKHLRQTKAGAGAAPEVEIRLQDETGYQWKGRLDFTDNALDAGSGTLRGRAVVANPGGFLTPGMFGNMRLAAGPPRQALLVPDAAVQTDQARKVVLVVGADGKVAVKPVEPGARLGSLRSIRSGLAPQDRVIVAGSQYAPPGTTVTQRQTRVTLAAATPERSYASPPPSQATLAR
jgi:membrane fusion protein, multidrug efflux system